MGLIFFALGVSYWREYPILYFPHADVLKIMFPLHRVPVFSLTFVFAVQADCNRQSKHDLLIPDSGRLPRAAFLVSSSLHSAHTHVHKHTNIHTKKHICVYKNAHTNEKGKILWSARTI